MIPMMRWAETVNGVTVRLAVGGSPVKIDFEEQMVRCRGEKFAMDLRLFGKIDAKECTCVSKSGEAFVQLEKAVPGFWKQLVCAKNADELKARIKVDWEMWQDEDDEEDDDAEFGRKKIDFSDLPVNEELEDNACEEKTPDVSQKNIYGFQSM